MKELGRNVIVSMICILMTVVPIVQALPSSEIIDKNEQTVPIDYPHISDITLKDDGFHKTDQFFHIESWYYDAVFDNNYSCAIVITVMQKGEVGAVLTGLYLYHQTNLIMHRREWHRFNQCYILEDTPYLQIGNTTVISGDIDPETNIWYYDISMETQNIGINLHFQNLTQGWKMNICGGWWLVIPHSVVTGTINYNGTTIPVSGEGYHDHNWFYISTPFMQRGWHYCSIVGDSHCITFARVCKSLFNKELYAVFTTKNEKPVLIDQNDVSVSISKYLFSHGKLIPKTFTIQINSDQIQAEVNLEAVNQHHVKLPFLNYWRCHLTITGNITYNGVTENVDRIVISEVMRFF